MSRACVRSQRQPDGSWTPVTVFLGTNRALQGKTLPGDPERDQWLAAILQDALPPYIADTGTERGTFEDWIGYAVGDRARGWTGALSNGHDTWCVEVEPELTLQALYEREVLGVPSPVPLTRPDLKPTTEAPTNLGGYRSGPAR